jgi:hypothetical protein
MTGMDSDKERLQEGLLKAYEMIRDQADVICDLMNLLAPLIQALDASPQLGKAYQQKQKDGLNESIRLKRDSLAVVDDAIQRLKAEMKQ